MNPLAELAGKVDPASNLIAHLTMHFDGRNLAAGTGIFIECDVRTYLVTAWHNFSGREPDTLDPKSPTGGLPNFVRVESTFAKYELPLYSGTNRPWADPPLYFLHSQGQKIDVTVLPLPQEQRDITPALSEAFLDKQYCDALLPFFVSQTCFIVGFPDGLIDRHPSGAVLPIWKTGHLASEPHTNFNGEPVVLIDATTRPGLSGSPVIVRGKNGLETTNRLVGIYAGRTRTDGAIGYVFKTEVIREIISEGPFGYDLLPFRNPWEL